MHAQVSKINPMCKCTCNHKGYGTDIHFILHIGSLANYKKYVLWVYPGCKHKVSIYRRKLFNVDMYWRHWHSVYSIYSVTLVVNLSDLSGDDSAVLCL